MSLPKEPRQKMINLMYLVLTALLALNVSSEILNAFKTVDNSLQNANKTVDKKDKEVMASFEELLKDGKTHDNAAKWKPLADQAKQISDQLVSEIETLKADLKKEAGLGKMGKSEKGDDLYKEDDLEAATRLFIGHEGKGGGKGEELKNKLVAIKEKLLNLSPEIRTALGNSLPIDISTPDNKDWSQTYFHMTPTVAALTILSKFENDVKNSSSQVVEFCHQQVGQVKLIFDQFQAIASQSSEYVMPGQEVRITAGVGAFSKSALPSVSIDGSAVPLNAEGVAELKFNAGATGSYSKKVSIRYTKPDGTPGSAEKEIKYVVGSPTGVTVSATKVNVLYRDLDNPVAISGGTKGAEAITAVIDNGSIAKEGTNGVFIVKPGAGAKATINVTVDGKSTPFTFPVKRIPDPTPKVGASGGGTTSAVSFKAQAGIRADMGDFVFEGVKFTVSKYTIICNGKGFENTGPKYKTVDGAYFDEDVKSFIAMCKAGSSVTIQDIFVDGPGGRRKLEASMGFSLTN
jgi:gliding motility-associated protein GldM